MKRRNDNAPVRLPDEVLERLALKGVPKVATAIRRSEGPDMTLTTIGLEAMTRRIRAEREMYEEVRKLEEARGEAATVDELRQQVLSQETTIRDLRDALDMAQVEARRSIAAVGVDR